MATRVVLPPAMVAQIAEAGDYIAEHNPTAARAMIERLDERCRSLEFMPERGADYGPNHHLLTEGQYQIIYRIEIGDDRETTVVIVALHHSRRRPLEL